MLEVYFESDKDVIRFCEQLFQYNKELDLHWRTHDEWGNQLLFEKKLPGNQLEDTIAKAMADVFTFHRLGDMIRTIIRDVYYYTDHEEIERVVELTEWIFAGEDEDSLYVRKTGDPVQLLYALFIANTKDLSAIHYDSIVNFRLRVFREQLIQYVGLAIDEFKREEDHQAFLNMLREYMVKKEPGEDTIHVLQGNPFLFFNSEGKKLSRLDLAKRMQMEPLYIFGLDENEWNLAPLIAMAPKKVMIYGDHPSEPKTLTVINVFQEKADFLEYSKFPFPYARKRPK